MKPKLIVILGPTASGKTDLAAILAKKYKGEIVSADSRQVYKEMFIGTASPFKKNNVSRRHTQGNDKSKTKPFLFKGIPHHLFHIVSPNKKFNVAVYKNLAVKTIKDIQKRGKLPFLVGGTGLYIKSLVDNIKFPKTLPQGKLRKNLEKKSVENLFLIYKKLDSKGAKFIDGKNKRRLIRAIEVCKATGKPFWRQREKEVPLFDVLEIGLSLPKNKLKDRVSKRTEKMIRMGLEKEVKNLVRKYGWPAIFRTIGYQEWRDCFEGKINKNEVKEKIKLHTLQFIKRQMTWFRRDEKIHWIKNCLTAEKLLKKFLGQKK